MHLICVTLIRHATVHTCRFYTCIYKQSGHIEGSLTPQQVEIVRAEQLEAKEGENDLKGERAAIHKVPVEQLNCVVKHYDAPVLGFRYKQS